jgi:hypothetical protein
LLRVSSNILLLRGCASVLENSTYAISALAPNFVERGNLRSVGRQCFSRS